MDILYIPALERFAANMPFVRGLSLKGNPSYPCLTAYFEAMDSLPAYQEVCRVHNVFGSDNIDIVLTLLSFSLRTVRVGLGFRVRVRVGVMYMVRAMIRVGFRVRVRVGVGIRVAIWFSAHAWRDTLHGACLCR